MPYKSKRQERAYHATKGWKEPVKKTASNPKPKPKGRKSK